MALELHTITFNHDPNSALTSALNIRRNKDYEVPVPEYDSSIPRPPEQSCAAYAKTETEGKNVYIRVNFKIPAPANITYEVKASGGEVMGNLDPFQVIFGGGSVSETVDIQLIHRNFSKVGRHDITWQWSYRVAGSPSWQNLIGTSHRIYTILAVPKSPWTQTFGDKRNPWTDLMDECCSLASGSSDSLMASKKIAKKINSSYNLRYDIITGAPRYGYRDTGDSFRLTNWINYVLQGNPPSFPLFCQGTAEEYKNYWIVNCYDCAASLALMSQVVGAPQDYYFHSPFGYLNYVVPIGRGKCNNPFPGCTGNDPVKGPDDPRTRFGNHAYTKLSAGKDYDATMKQWVPPLLRVLLIILWILILIITLGMVNLKESLLERAGGWLLNLTQSDYEKKTIDTSESFEASAAGGSPTLQTLQFSVT
jgi:hypothetical protein